MRRSALRLSMLLPEDPPATGGDTGPDAPPAPDAPPDLGEPGKAALAKERAAARAAAKERDAALAELQKLKDAQLSEQERAVKERDAATARAAAAEREALVLRVAIDKQIAPELADRLRGDTREELEADAERLAALLAPADAKPAAPKPDPSQGGKQTPVKAGFEEGRQRARERFGLDKQATTAA